MSSHGGVVAEKGRQICRKNDDQENFCDENDRKGKRVSRFRVRKLRRRNKLPSSSSKSWKFGGCFACFGTGGATSKSSVESSSQETSDPNSSGFTFEVLKGLIEKNDFFSKECNTHLD